MSLSHTLVHPNLTVSDLEILLQNSQLKDSSFFFNLSGAPAYFTAKLIISLGATF